jgi:hypothetical protein
MHVAGFMELEVYPFLASPDANQSHIRTRTALSRVSNREGGKNRAKRNLQ